MASRKNLKKTVNYISGVVTSLCLMDASQAPAEKRGAYGSLFMNIADLQNEIIQRINHTEPGSVKLFYKKLKEDFNKGIDGIFAKLEELAKNN